MIKYVKLQREEGLVVAMAETHLAILNLAEAIKLYSCLQSEEVLILQSTTAARSRLYEKFYDSTLEFHVQKTVQQMSKIRLRTNEEQKIKESLEMFMMMLGKINRMDIEDRQVVKHVMNWSPQIKIVLGTRAQIARHRCLLNRVRVMLVEEASQAKAIDIKFIVASTNARVVLAGDILQLPPHNNFSSKLVNFGAHSILEELESRLDQTNKLTIAYRFNRQLAEALATIKEGYLIPHKEVSRRHAELLNMLELPTPGFPIVILNNQTEDDILATGTRVNRDQQRMAIKLARAYVKLGARSVAILSPYVGARQEMLEVIQKDEPIIANTVESFQGQEAEVVIFIATKFEKNALVHVEEDFVLYSRRAVTALTRPKTLLCIVGNLDYLKKSPVYQKIVEYALRHTNTVGEQYVHHVAEVAEYDSGAGTSV